jgi:hypothetical protein
MTAPAMCRCELPQFNEFESERLDVRDEPVQRGTVGDGTHQQRFGAHILRLERIQGDHQRRRQPALDPEGVVGTHVDLPSEIIVLSAMIGASG